MDKSKKLYKANTGKMLDGVCAGFAEYFGIDPTLVRVVWALITLFWGTGILLYIACMIIIPRKPSEFIEGEKVE